MEVWKEVWEPREQLAGAGKMQRSGSVSRSGLEQFV